MKQYALLGGAAAIALGLAAGCAVAPHRIDPAGDETLTSTHKIDVKDWQTAALKSIDSLLESGALVRADGRKTVVMVGEVRNSTSTPVNTRILTDKIRQAILKSGKAVTTTAVGAKGAEETATRQVRELENDDLFNQATVQKRGTVISPDMSLSGEIVQQKNKVGRVEESYFFFHVVMTDLATGLAVWEDNVEIGKQETRSIFD